MRLSFLASIALAAAATSGLAQSRSSFLNVDGFDDILLSISNGGLTYTVAVGAAPKMHFGGNTYDVTGVMGIWALSNDDDLVATVSDDGVWTANQSNSGTGGIAGWKTNSPNALHVGETHSWTFDSLNTASVEQQGLHVMLSSAFPGTGGNTGYATVPEPSGLLALLACVPLVFARRFARK